MNDDVITIVSGLPRSGTSMMMEMLDKGGVEALTDEVRTPDKDNPKGYYEYERVKDLPEDTDWLEKAEGKSVKVLGELIKHIPQGYRYKVIFMERHLDEIVESQEKMLIRKGKDRDDVSKDDLKDTLKDYRAILKEQISSHPNMEVLYVSYNDIMSHPEPVIESVSAFFAGELDKESMMSVIDEELYRNRAEE
ncbi:MAG: sulfotransferase family protein [Candidatus Thermoplasmatota archaeon]|nr:sulfotransferase family protein [Candidatus Thermoplasmatota archaeon]